MIAGHATSAGTKKLAKENSVIPYVPLGPTGFLVSSVGFGTYRIDLDTPEHHESLKKSLLAGINLIDTSANYGDGESESQIGKTVSAVLKQRPRESIVIVSKAGYIQGNNFIIRNQQEKKGNPFPEVVDYSPGLAHCIHPIFLADQLTRSLERLGMETIDIYLLHNPEYYLGWAAKSKIPLAQARNEYYRRIKEAFTYLETEVKIGRIQYYGVSSNTFTAHSNDYDFTSLSELYTIAQKISPSHHFRVVQMPMNLFENGAILEMNQKDGLSVLDVAQRLNVGVLINRPLNAIVNGGLVRLSDDYQNTNGIAVVLRTEMKGYEDATLSQMAINTLRSTVGISCVLVGMRQLTYVSDVIAALGKPIVLNFTKETWRRIRAAFIE